jgi:hypothetical protein
MSLLGKILLFVNLLAAAGLVYLTSQDYAKRREINGTLLRYRLAIDGVPVEKGEAADGDVIPFVVQITPGAFTDTVSKSFLDGHFGGSGVASQAGEVEAQLSRLEANLAGLPTDGKKLEFLCGAKTKDNQFEAGLLFRMAETFEEREAIRELAIVTDPAKIKPNYDDAVLRVRRKFEALISKPNPGAALADQQKLSELKDKAAAKDETANAELKQIASMGAPAYTRDDADRRLRIAQLLMLLDTSAGGQKRVMLISGLRIYTKAVAEQASRMEEIVRRIERQIEQDQLKFQSEYELLKGLAQEQDSLLYQQLRVLAGLQSQLAEDDKAVQLRQTQVDYLKKELAAVNATVAKLLAEQAKVEASLFEAQQKVGRLLQENLATEQRLLNMEQAKK